MNLLTAEKPRDWIEYWNQDDFWTHSRLWRINAELFFRRAAPIVHFKKTDSVLNVGCGLGYLETQLTLLVESVYALDTSERFINLCQENCRGYQNVTIKLQGKNYTDLSVCGKRFSLILCVSLVQYYRDIGEVEDLIRSAREIALPGARMLIADLPQKRGVLGFTWDAWCSFLLSVQESDTPLFLRTAGDWFGKRLENGRFYNNLKPLYFSNDDLLNLIQRMKLNATIIKENFSVYANRPSLLIYF